MSELKGNAQSVFTCNGASNHTDKERAEQDYYATEPHAVFELLRVEKFSPSVWENACGGGHISEVLSQQGYCVYSTDIINRGYEHQSACLDFLNCDYRDVDMDIITNPPYKLAKEFVKKSLEVIGKGHKVAMLLKLTFLESKTRRELFDTSPPARILVFSSRVHCVRNGNFEKYKKGVGDAIAYAWYVWEKGYKGDPIVKWIN